MHSKSDNIEIMIYDNPDEIIEEPFELLFSRYQVGFKTQMTGSDLMHYDALIYFIANVINKTLNVAVHILILQIG